MKQFALALLAGLILSACNTTPSPPASTSLSPWVNAEANPAVHRATGAQCPETFGTFLRTDVKTIAVEDRNGDSRDDAICQYRDNDYPAMMTVYFYDNEGRTIAEELQLTAFSMKQALDAEALSELSSSCNTRVQLALGVVDLKAKAEDVANRPHIIEGANLAACTVMTIPQSGATTYGAVAKLNDQYVQKLRITSVLPGDESHERIITAISEFFTQ